jgi:EAL domain-containing protein (putative c-di-GMP-specific phosphodiesterase class I)
MYVAKHDHIKFAEYDVAKDCNTIDFLTMPYAITNAIKKNEFELYYQPKMCLKTSKIVGVESLIRWNHQSGRVIPPSMFIEFAEKTGLIRELTEWIIKETVLTNAKLQELGIDIDISINISANNLNDPEIMVAISTALSDNNICPENLILEVTETAIMSDPDMSIKILVSLESLGIKLSLDDFGTGHSSFLYLKYIPLREIKIDRSFIKDIHTYQHDMSIVKSTIGLAHEMGCVVVAEGVETQEVEDLLRELDCDLAQGYHILPPVPFDSLVEWFKENGGYNE